VSDRWSLGHENLSIVCSKPNESSRFTRMTGTREARYPDPVVGGGGQRLLLTRAWVWYRTIGAERKSHESGSRRTHEWRRLRSTLSVLLVVGGFASRGLADPLAEITVRWEAPEECPDRVALDTELHRDLEGSQAPSVRLMVRAHVSQLHSDTWRVAIVAESNDGRSERSITAHSCQALLDATSLIVAMLIDPETAATHARPIDATTETGAVSPAATSSKGAAQPEASNEPRNPPSSETKKQNQAIISKGQVLPIQNPSRMRASGFVGAWAAIDSGSLPSVTEAFGGSLGLVYGPWRGETSFVDWLPKSQSSNQADYRQATGEFTKIAGRARLCLMALAAGRLGLGPCAGVELARLSGKANEYLTGEPPPHSWFMSADVGAIGLIKLADVLAVRLDLDVLISLKRTEFSYSYQDQPRSLFRPAQVATRGSAGIELYFR
jgi:hypothetical protein